MKSIPMVSGQPNSAELLAESSELPTSEALDAAYAELDELLLGQDDAEIFATNA